MSDHQYYENPFKDYSSGGIAFVGCILVGTGVGLLFKPLYIYLSAGVLIGAGVGFIAMALISRDRFQK